MISKDTSPLEVYACEFVIDNGHLGFVATDADRNLCIFVYSPESKESMGGQRLIRKADMYIGKFMTVFQIYRIPVYHQDNLCGFESEFSF
jgi:cleavage and polyadenylation specificity factor subunit 1